jgi:hypothetical protein
VGAAFVAALAFVAAVFAVGLAARAVTEVRDDAAAPGAGASAMSTPTDATRVGLGDFTIDPGDLQLDAGGVLTLETPAPWSTT